MEGPVHVAAPAGSAVGTRLRVVLGEGQVLDGVVIGADDRLLRLRTAGQPRLVVVYRRMVTGVEVM